MVLGNKCDLDESRVVTKERGSMLANEHGIKFYETSAKSGLNVEEAFITLARDIKDKMDKPVSAPVCVRHACIGRYTCARAHTHGHGHTHTRTWTHTHTCTHTQHTHTHTRTHHTNTRAHTHARAHTHTCTNHRHLIQTRCIL